MEMSGYEYTCAGGETWDSIALEIFDDEKYAAEIMAANPRYSGRVVFTGGEVLQLPLVEMPEDEDTTAPVSAPWKEGE